MKTRMAYFEILEGIKSGQIICTHTFDFIITWLEFEINVKIIKSDELNSFQRWGGERDIRIFSGKLFSKTKKLNSAAGECEKIVVQ